MIFSLLNNKAKKILLFVDEFIESKKRPILDARVIERISDIHPDKFLCPGNGNQ